MGTKCHQAAVALFFAMTTLLAIPWSVAAQDRMPVIPPEKMTEAQKKAVAEVTPPNGSFPVYLVPLLRSPEAMVRVKSLGDYVVRSNTALSKKLTEFVILLVNRHWTEQYSWVNHYPAALKAGLNADIADAVAEGRRPERMSEEEQVIYDFCTELQRHQSVSETTYNRMVTTLGEKGIIDTIALVSYYTTLAMVFNTTHYNPSRGSTTLRAKPLPSFPQ
jgi:4-carboxymuconolactone decarboxylase